MFADISLSNLLLATSSLVECYNNHPMIAITSTVVVAVVIGVVAGLCQKHLPSPANKSAPSLLNLSHRRAADSMDGDRVEDDEPSKTRTTATSSSSSSIGNDTTTLLESQPVVQQPWKCVCETGLFLPASMLQGMAVLRMSTGQCYHKPQR
jgi:hypothetical protein